MDERTPEQVMVSLFERHGYSAFTAVPYAAQFMAALRAEGYAVVKVDERMRYQLADVLSGSWGANNLHTNLAQVDALLAALGLSEPVETGGQP